MKHKGLHQYSGDEASNLSMSQLGWDMMLVLDDVAVEKACSTEYWVAIKILNDNVELQAKSHPDFKSDDLTNDASEYDHLTDQRIACTHGDVIYGCFTSVSVAGIADDEALVQLIRGK